ncbi:MAG: glycoside hydrolase family 127 protein [Clostridia bacterium]|nr:glycoside hydrolase family 127 protein [Clostridia bacterium]
MSDYSTVPFDSVKLAEGFWKRRLEINRAVTAKAVYDRFSETHRFDALDCRLYDGMGYEPHIFWDSDVAKWLEGAAYLLAERKDCELERICEGLIEKIIENQTDDGYFNSYYLAVEPENRFTRRENHELYCAGHLIEAAIAYRAATGKDEFLTAMRRYADLICKVFYVDKSAAFATPGHPEIELALFRLYDVTGDEKYANLAKYFLDIRGNNEKDIPNPEFRVEFDQSHKPLKEQTVAEGHAVRAGYIYSAMADAALRFDDAEYASVCKRLFDNIATRRMYITGGIGSTASGEAFTEDYDLPNESAYAETCAAIALAYFSRRMLLLKPDSKYADTVERIMYNGMLSGISLEGDRFFYTNPLEVSLPGIERSKMFYCSCCPPNIFRFIASITESFYTYNEDTLYIHQFAASTANVRGAAVSQTTSYPANGEVKIVIGGGFEKAAIRIPFWCRAFSVSEPYVLKDGYAEVAVPENGEITVSFDMPPRFVESDPHVRENAGKRAVMRGPVVYCIEGKDNGGGFDSLSLMDDASFEEELSDTIGVSLLKTKGLRSGTPVPLTFIPYFAFADRGPDEMKVWIKMG